ncbi:MAG: transposase [Gemmataceae bacterium]|nr:transposase [Gemmataceae bacterium]
MLAPLRPAGTDRDSAGNRRLFFDQYAQLLLLYYFNPAVTSLRGVQQFTTPEKVQRTFGIRTTALGSLSEAARVFDPALLEPILAELAQRTLARPDARPPAEREALAGKPGEFYVMDRGYVEYDLLRELDAGGSRFVQRLAENVVLAYRHRWQVELFFRWLKCIPGCRHLLAENPAGVTIQVYLAIIASLLIGLWTGAKPTKRTHEMLCHYFNGWATTEEVERYLDTLKQKDRPPSK